MSTTVVVSPGLMPLGPRAGRSRRWLSLLSAVVLPAAAMGAYLYGVADDQYVTEFRFSVRHQAPLRMEAAASSALGGPLSGAGSAMAVINDSQIVIQYLKSRQIIDDIAATGIDLDAIYGSGGNDIVAHLPQGAPAEERLRYWRRMVDPFFDMSTGIVSVEVRAFRPEDARLVAARTLALAEKLVNDISDRSHRDVLAYALKEAADSGDKLKAAQAALSAYRNEHAVLFPEMQATESTTVGGLVEQSLIEARTAFSTQLAQGVARDSMQMRILANRIAAMEAALHGVNGRMAQSDGAASLASVMSEYSILKVSEEIAARVYERALMSLQDARNAASEQGVYLTAFVRPALPQDSMYPVRWRAMLETALVGFAAWCLLQLIYHGIRDHLD